VDTARPARARLCFARFGRGCASFALDGTLSLYVNGFNRTAMALYERVGFTRVGTLATYLFP
jgi:predicted GNAT family acetyltransferase